jgi:peptide/nickel transport system substrate-binding protein
VAFQVLARGDLDVAGVRPEDWVRGAEEPSFEERFTKYTYPQSAYTYIGWNMRRPLFEDKRVRRAMTMLLDRETIRDTIYEGLARIVTGNFMPGTPASNPEVEPWPFDPQAAQELLDEAGWVDSDGDGIRDRDGTPFRFEMLIGSGSSTAENVATIFQEELARVGIEMGIRQLEWASMLQRTTSREFDAMMMGWQMPPDPDPYQVWHSSQADAGSNYVGFEHARADDIIEQARVAFNDDERNALYREFHSIVHEEQPYTFMFNPLALLAVDKRVHNVNMYTYGPQSLEWFVPEPLQKY